MESMKRRDLILQTYQFICEIQNVGLTNQASAINKALAMNLGLADHIMTKGI
jgi:hypothetical protein